MKRKTIFFILTLLLISSICIASSVTYYDGHSILLENYEGIEILSNEVLIDTTNSNVSNEILLKNTGTSRVKIKVSIKLEDNILSTKIHNLSIKANGATVEYTKDQNGIYSFDIAIPKKEGKKIEIQYVTDNNLADAKIIKYNLDNLQLGDKKIGKVKINIKLNEIDIPLTKAIYPGHYKMDFETNTLSVEYYNFKVNNLTRNIILEKDTLKDIYRNSEQLELPDRNIALNIDKWIKNGMKIDYEKLDYIDDYLIYKQLFNPKDYKEDFWSVTSPYRELFAFYLNKQLIKDGKYEYIQDEYYLTDIKPLYNEYIKNLVLEYSLDDQNQYLTSLYGKTICILYELLPIKEDLYVYKDHMYEAYNEEYGEYYCDFYVELVKKSQDEILTTIESSNSLFHNSGEKRIFVGIDTNGAFIDCTYEEKIEYVNMINSDMLIIQKLYDKELGEENSYTTFSKDGTEIQIKHYNPPYVGYYGEENEEMVKEFYTIHYEIMSEDEFYDRDWLVEQYESYENYILHEKIEEEENYKNSVIKLDDSKLELAQIPTFILYRGYIYDNEGKKFVNFQLPYNSYGTGISATNQVLETKRAQELLTANKEKNNNIKNMIEEEICNIKLTNTKDIEDERKNQLNNKNQETNTQHTVVLSIISLGILICIVILIFKGIKNKKNKGGNNDGEEK